MTGSLQIKKGYYYVVLSYKSKNDIRTKKWISTGFEIKNNKRKAEALIEQYVKQYSHLEQEEVIDVKKILFTDAMSDWLVRVENKVEKSTYEGYTIYVNKHLIPYFRRLKLYLNKVTPKHIRDYYDYKYKGGRLDGKPGGLDIQSIKKHSMVDGKLYRPDYITRAFQKVLKRNGFQSMRFHDLRHSTASILHDKGWTLKDIQEWVRHASIDMTADIYTHISNLRKQTMTKDLEKTFIQ